MKPVLGFLLALLAPWAAIAQNAPPAPGPAVPTVTFDLFWPQATPQHVTITAQANGEATFAAHSPTAPPDANGIQGFDYETRFAMSPAMRDKIFALARQANYFNGQFDYKKHAIANTGKKTLTYADSTRHFSTAYNWSDNPAVDRLTRLFQGISAAIEDGRELEFLHRFDKLGLEGELKTVEDQEASHFLSGLAVIAPTLQSIANDPAVLNIARQRARRLLAQSAGEDAKKKIKAGR